jgi:hypothetical protein
MYPVEFNSKFQESVWISVKLVGGDELLVGCIYRSNSGTDENNEYLLKLLNEVNKAKYSHVLIMGDFNFVRFKSATLILVLFTNIHLRQNNNSVLIEIRKEELYAYNQQNPI